VIAKGAARPVSLPFPGFEIFHAYCGVISIPYARIPMASAVIVKTKIVAESMDLLTHGGITPPVAPVFLFVTF
jgi:hypothetical protein